MARPISDEGQLERHTRETPMGRIRPATLEETERREDFFRPDAVLALTGAPPMDVSPFEAHVAALIDGARPVARIRKKSGVSSADLRIALAALCDRKLLRLVGVVEEAVGSLANDIAADVAQRAQEVIVLPLPPGYDEPLPAPEDVDVDDVTMPHGAAGIVPRHVMAEIQLMMDEQDLLDDD